MNSQPTVIGAHTRVKGTLEGEEDLHVFGRIDGTLALSGSLTVDQDGVVVADVEASQALISGTVVGNVTAQAFIHITSTGRVVGDLSAPRVVIEDGASYRGSVDMGEVDTSRPGEGSRPDRSASGSATAGNAPSGSPASGRLPPRPLAGRPGAESLRGLGRPPASSVPRRSAELRPIEGKSVRPEEKHGQEERRPLPRPEPRSFAPLSSAEAPAAGPTTEPQALSTPRSEPEALPSPEKAMPSSESGTHHPLQGEAPFPEEAQGGSFEESKIPRPPTTAGRKTRARRK